MIGGLSRAGSAAALPHWRWVRGDRRAIAAEHLRRGTRLTSREVLVAAREASAGGGPDSFEEGAVFGASRGSPSVCLRGGGEEMQLFAGASAGDVVEALALGGFAGRADGVEPLVERVVDSAPLP